MSFPPNIQIFAVSNVYCRLMHFENKNDVEHGHVHSFDHGTLLSKGSLFVEMMNEDFTVSSSKVYKAPCFIFINKDKHHRLTALEDDTVACCIHALRDINEDIIPPDTYVEHFESTANNNLLRDLKQKGIDVLLLNQRKSTV